MTQTLKENYFHKINTQKKGYYLGWMFSDGYVSSNGFSFGFCLNSKDKEHIINFIKDLHIDQEPYFYKNRDAVAINVANQKMHEDLIKLGCVPKKSLVIKAPRKVPKRLAQHFIRGYFDGDGSIGFQTNQQPQLSFVGTKELMEWIQKQIPVKSGLYGFKHTQNNTYRIVITKQADVIKMYSYLYKDATCALSRKKEKFQEVINNLKGR